MSKTVVFVTNQYSCDRIICSARTVANETSSELLVVGILDSEYELNPEAIDYLFLLSKQNKATMRLLFTEDKVSAMREAVGQYGCKAAVTGMPSSNQSVLYTLWKEFPGVAFYTVDLNGEIVEVAASHYCTA